MLCSNLEHDDYEVLPVERNGHCLFLCLVNILRERDVAGRPRTQQAMRNAIADYFDQHGGAVWYQEVEWPCDDAIRTNGYGGTTEVMAFTAIYGISIEIHCPETSDGVQEISCGGSDVELLLQTVAWEENGRRAPVGDHWQRMRKKPAAAAGGGGGVAMLSEHEISEIDGTDIDAAVLAELPVEIRDEIIAQHRSVSRSNPSTPAFGPAAAANPLSNLPLLFAPGLDVPEGLAPEFFAQLPPDVQADVRDVQHRTRIASASPVVPEAPTDYTAPVEAPISEEHPPAAALTAPMLVGLLQIL